MAFVRALIKVFQFFVCWKKETNEGGKKKKKKRKLMKCVVLGSQYSLKRSTTMFGQPHECDECVIPDVVFNYLYFVRWKKTRRFIWRFDWNSFLRVYKKKSRVKKREREKEWWNNRFATKHKTCVELKQTMGKAI